MDDQFIAFAGDEHDDLEQVRCSVGTDDQPSVWVFAEIVDDERVFDRVEDVVVRDAVATDGRVDLHTQILYYEIIALSSLGDEGDDDVGGVPVEVLSAVVVDRPRARIGVSSGQLHIAQWNTSVERRHDEPSAQHVRVDVTEPGALTDRLHPAMCGAPIEPLPISTDQDRALVPLADYEIDRAGSARNKWDHRRLVALAGDTQRSMSALEAEVLDVRGAGLGDAQSIETQQHGECCVGAVALLGGEQEASQLAAIHPVRLGRLDLGSANILSRVSRDAPIDVRELRHHERNARAE